MSGDGRHTVKLDWVENTGLGKAFQVFKEMQNIAWK